MQTDTEVGADIAKFHYFFSGLETEPISESASLSEFKSGNSSNKNRISLSEFANLPSAKAEEGELIDCGSTAAEPYLNEEDLIRIARLRPYAHRLPCLVTDDI